MERAMNTSRVFYLWRTSYDCFYVSKTRPKFSTDEWDPNYNGIEYCPTLVSEDFNEFEDDEGMEDLLDCEYFAELGLIKVKLHLMSPGKKYKPSKKRVRVIKGIKVRRAYQDSDWGQRYKDEVQYIRREVNPDDPLVVSCTTGFEEMMGVSTIEVINEDGWDAVIEILEDYGVQEPTEKEIEKTRRRVQRYWWGP